MESRDNSIILERKCVEKISKFFLATNEIFDYFPQITYKKNKKIDEEQAIFSSAAKDYNILLILQKTPENYTIEYIEEC